MRTVVIGGGVIGLTSAYELALRGHDVTVIEAERCGSGASHGNAAKIAIAESTPVPAPGVLLQGIRWMLSPDSPLSIRPSLAPGYLRFLLRMAAHCNTRDFAVGLDLLLRLGEDANDLFDEYQRQGIDFEMHDRGVLLAFATRERFDEHCESLPAFEAAGHHPRCLHDDEVYEAEPALSERIRHGLFFPDDRQLEPDSLTAGLLAKLSAFGVDVREGTRIGRFVRTGDTVTAVVTTDAEVIGADSFVIAAGVPSGALAAEIGEKIPICSGKGYSIDYAPAPIELKTSLTLEDARVAVTPLNGMLRLAGTMEFGSRDDRVNDTRVGAIRRSAQEAFRDWGDGSGEQNPWAGSRPMAPDGLPVIGRLASVTNVFINSGHSMLGLTLAPGSARLLAGLMTDGRPTLSEELLTRISPSRF
ncbi:FAD-dependent oxidoreductase [Brevibacterium atlanticum]|uniref:FAD-dependent oxidoreductase n=1 Tax=Brevibacterium atlanticum TaxID=2697563 RepID=UPI0014204731|nr:FAD-dependent oxidoreductase [Brevibacterium atlanticum]